MGVLMGGIIGYLECFTVNAHADLISGLVLHRDSLGTAADRSGQVLVLEYGNRLTILGGIDGSWKEAYPMPFTSATASLVREKVKGLKPWVEVKVILP